MATLITSFVGVNPTGTYPCSAAIQAALDSGADLEWPPGVYALNSTITHTIPGQRNIAQGRAAPTILGLPPATYGVELKWVGALGGDMLNIKALTNRWEWENFYFNGNNTASVAARVISAQFGGMPGCVFANHRVFGVLETVMANPPPNTVADSLHNYYTDNFFAPAEVDGAMGMCFTGQGSINSCYAQVHNVCMALSYSHYHYGFYMQYCDSVKVYGTQMFGGPKAAGVTFDYTANDWFPNSCSFHDLDVGGGLGVGLQNAGIPNPGTFPNFIVNLLVGNQAHVPARLPNLVIK